MGLISPPQVSDGVTGVNAASVNNPVNVIAAEFNGNIDNANIKAGAAIATGKLAADNGITAGMIGTTAIKLGKGAITANITTASTTNVQATGLTASVTIPAGGRAVKITAMLPSISNTTSGQAIAVNIWSGTVGSGTQLQEAVWFSTGANVAIPLTLVAEHTPSAGAVTYNLGYRASANTATIAATATTPAFLLVEAI